MAGFGLLVPVLLVVVVVAGFYLWARRQGQVVSGPDGSGRHSSVSLLTEAVAYVGGILVVSGAIAAAAQRWTDLSEWAHVGMLTAGAVLFLVGGFLMRKVDDDAIQRLVSVSWFVSAGGMAAAVAVAAREIHGSNGRTTLLVTGVATTLYAGALWRLRPRALQNVAVFCSLIVLVCGVLADTVDRPTGIMFGLSLWGLGIAWAALGALRAADPLWTSMPVGILLALLAPTIGLGAHGWMFAVALATAGVLMAASVPMHNTPLLGLSTVAMFAYLTSMLVRYFKDSLGVPAALAVAGLLILGLAVVSARLMRAARAPSEQQQARSGAPDDEQVRPLQRL